MATSFIGVLAEASLIAEQRQQRAMSATFNGLATEVGYRRLWESISARTIVVSAPPAGVPNSGTCCSLSLVANAGQHIAIDLTNDRSTFLSVISGKKASPMWALRVPTA